jgi:hypothetical protein
MNGHSDYPDWRPDWSRAPCASKSYGHLSVGRGTTRDLAQNDFPPVCRDVEISEAALGGLNSGHFQFSVFADMLKTFDDRWEFVRGSRAAKKIALAFGASRITQLV